MNKVKNRSENLNCSTYQHLTPTDYLAQRVEAQLSWYSRRSGDNKRWYYRLQLLTLVSTVSVPVLALSSGDIRIRFLVAIMGAVAALATGVLSVYQFRDQWLDYRSTAESIKHEKHLFLTRAHPYVSEGAFQLFVQRIESIIISENRNWRSKSFNLPKASADQTDTTSDTVANASLDSREVAQSSVDINSVPKEASD